MSDEPRDDADDSDEPTEDETPVDGDADAEDPAPAAADDEPADDAVDTDDEADEPDDDESEDESEDGESAEDGSEDADEVVPASKPKSGPPPAPSKRDKAERTNPRPKPKSKQAKGGGRRARRRRLRRPASIVLSILAIIGVVALVAVLGTRASDGHEATAWTYAIATAAGVVALSAVSWALTVWNLRNRGLGALTFILVLAVISLTAVSTTGASPQLGLDLQGGFSVVLSAKGDPPSENIDQAMGIIRNRIDALGVAEPEVTRQGDNVVVDLPGIDDRARAQEILGETALLEFRPVLLTGLPYDAAADEAGEDPCAAGVAALNEAAAEASIPIDTTVTDPAATDPTATTVPGDTTETDPTATTAPAETTVPATEAPAGDSEEGVGPTPAPSSGAVSDGEQAAPLPRQEEPTTTTAGETTTTSAPADTSTTAAVDPTATDPAATDPAVTDPAATDPAAGAGETIAVPYRPVADEEPTSCTQVGPVGFEGGSLSKAQAQLGGSTGSEWVVAVRVKKGDRAQANELINACASGAANCPPNPYTGEAAGAMAIVLDGEVISSPTVQAPNLADDEFVITGGGAEGAGFPQAEAKDLALKLRYGALPVEFTRSAERQISPTLGEDSLQAGILAGLLGLAAVALYLLVYYRALGVVVVMGLGVWSALMYGVVCWLSASRGLTLSLSGVVGIVVSLGTTVDSYVVHFERLKDEVRLGKSVRASTEKGFQLAFRTILTADIASLMGAVLLWYLTVGAVRGFAFFLGLSVVLDLFVAYFFDRPMVALLARSRFFVEHPVFGVARGLGRTADGKPITKTAAGAAS